MVKIDTQSFWLQVLQSFILFLQTNVFGVFQIFIFCEHRKIWFTAACNSTCSTTYYYSRVVIITSTLGIWPALNSLRDDTAAVYVLLLDQIEKKRNASSISFKWFGIFKTNNKYNTDLSQRNHFKNSEKSFSHISCANFFEHAMIMSKLGN